MQLPLSELLREPINSVIERQEHALDLLLSEQSNRVVLFGAGNLGRRLLAELRGIGIEPLAFCDNNRARWGTSLEGCPILSPAEAARRYGSNSLFIVTIWNPAHWYVETLEQLRTLRCQHISSYSPAYWRFAKTFLPFLLNDHPHKVYEEAENVLAAEQLWRDETSLQAYRSHVHWYATGDPSQLPGRPIENTYFPADIFSVSSREVLVDCGAFDGDTVRQLMDRVGDAFGSVHAIEADPLSLEKLDRFVHNLPAAIQGRIRVHRCAVGAKRSFVRFETTGTVDSKICDEGGVEIDCIPIDELFADTRITMIKMDIEGAEYEALLGGRITIVRDQPILAICVYHTQSDIWRIPLLIHATLPKHRLFLRAYEGDGFQTVVYAVPEERLAGNAV